MTSNAKKIKPFVNKLSEYIKNNENFFNSEHIEQTELTLIENS